MQTSKIIWHLHTLFPVDIFDMLRDCLIVCFVSVFCSEIKSSKILRLKIVFKWLISDMTFEKKGLKRQIKYKANQHWGFKVSVILCQPYGLYFDIVFLKDNFYKRWKIYFFQYLVLHYAHGDYSKWNER